MQSLLLEMKLISGKVSALCKLTWLLSESMNYKKTDSQMLKWLSLCRPSMLLPRLPDQCRSSSHSHFKFPVCNLCKALGTKRMMQGFSIEQKKQCEKNISFETIMCVMEEFHVRHTWVRINSTFLKLRCALNIDSFS